MTMRLFHIASLCLVSGACSSTSSTHSPDNYAGDTDRETPSGVEDGDTAGPLPTSWGLTGDLLVADGALDVATQALVFSTRDASCDVRAMLATADALETTPSTPAGLIQVYAISGAPETEATCTFRGPTQMWVGFGPPDAQLAPAADRAGVNLDTMYGLYLGEPGDTLQLVGLAGTQAQIEGGESGATEAPLADGTYRLLTLYGIPLTP